MDLVNKYRNFCPDKIGQVKEASQIRRITEWILARVLWCEDGSGTIDFPEDSFHGNDNNAGDREISGIV